MRSRSITSRVTPLALALRAIAVAGERVDVGCRDDAGAGPGGRDGGKPRPGREVEDVLAAHDGGMIENVAGERLAASPCEGPEGRRQSELAQLLFGLLPKLGRFFGEIEADFRRVRNDDEPCVRENEGRAIDDRLMAHGNGRHVPAGSCTTFLGPGASASMPR